MIVERTVQAASRSSLSPFTSGFRSTDPLPKRSWDVLCFQCQLSILAVCPFYYGVNTRAALEIESLRLSVPVPCEVLKGFLLRPSGLVLSGFHKTIPISRSRMQPALLAKWFE